MTDRESRYNKLVIFFTLDSATYLDISNSIPPTISRINGINFDNSILKIRIDQPLRFNHFSNFTLYRIIECNWRCS